MEFGRWNALSPKGLLEAPEGPAAVQLRCDPLLPYPTGQSAMVFYFYADNDARAALGRVFHDELLRPGVRGFGPLRFRVLPGGDEARIALERLFERFVELFGTMPKLHLEDPHETGSQPDDEAHA